MQIQPEWYIISNNLGDSDNIYMLGASHCKTIDIIE